MTKSVYYNVVSNSFLNPMHRHLILASGIEGMEGFRQRWSLHGRLTDTKYVASGCFTFVQKQWKTTFVYKHKFIFFMPVVI